MVLITSSTKVIGIDEWVFTGRGDASVALISSSVKQNSCSRESVQRLVISTNPGTCATRWRDEEVAMTPWFSKFVEECPSQGWAVADEHISEASEISV